MRRGEAIVNQITHAVRTNDGVWLCTFAVCGDGVSIASNCDGPMPWCEATKLRDWLDAMLGEDTNDKETT